MLGGDVGRLSGASLAVVLGSLVALIVPLGLGSAVVVGQEVVLVRAAPVADQWAAAQGWQISELTFRQGVLRIVALGPPPTITETGLREQLDSAGLAEVDARVTLVLGGSKDLPVR